MGSPTAFGQTLSTFRTARFPSRSLDEPSTACCDARTTVDHFRCICKRHGIDSIPTIRDQPFLHPKTEEISELRSKSRNRNLTYFLIKLFALPEPVRELYY